MVARLEDHNVVNEPLPPVYYVIIGRGPMAVVNHATLVATDWGRQRIDDHPILHVGFPNPWPRYVRHGLGQPNHLLSLPGFQAQNQPSNAGPDLSVDGGLNSQYFGACVDREFNRLRQAREVEVAQEWVALIQARANPGGGQVDNRIRDERNGQEVYQAVVDCIAAPWPRFPNDQAPYRLCLLDPQRRSVRLVYANAIDICTGPGRPNVAALNPDPPELVAARTAPWLTPEVWALDEEYRRRRTLNGVDAIRDEVQFQAGQRICVTAGGGVGLNAAEKSRNNGCALDWFGRTGLIPIFGNPRNITFLKHPQSVDACQPGSLDSVGIGDEDDLIAHTRAHRMGRGATLRAVADNNIGGVDVTLQPSGATTHIRDFWGNHSALHQQGYWEFSNAYLAEVNGMNLQPSRGYDRLVIPNGQSTREVGQPQAIAGHLNFTPVDRSGRMVALETADHLVRVLGAAANDYPGLDIVSWQRDEIPEGTPANHMWQYHATLPVSAVPDGFIVCGVNTAVANHYFDQNRNMNVNTMTRDEIATVINDPDLAGQIVQARHDNNGYADVVDLWDACGSQAQALVQLRYAY